jgi:AcrR family transcriptional regulator
LIRAAEAELEEKGIEGFTLRGAAKRAGVSHAAPAHHFRDTGAMLTALAVVAAERLGKSMAERRSRAADHARSRFLASGVGYIEFALENPHLFRLLFGSERPDSQDAELVARASEPFLMLVEDIAAIRGRDPMQDEDGLLDIAASWSIVHGIANLLIADRMRFLRPLLERDREAALARLIERALPK